MEGAYSGFSLEFGRMGEPLVPDNSEDWLKSIGLSPLTARSGRAPTDGNHSFYFYLGEPCRSGEGGQSAQ